MDAFKQLSCTVLVAVLLLISLHTSCAFPMADDLNAATKSSKTVQADIPTNEAHDSKELSDALRSNVALQELVRKYNDTGINVVSLLYNQQLKHKRQQRDAPSCTPKPRVRMYHSPTTSCSAVYAYVECQPTEGSSCKTSTNQSGCMEVKKEIKICGNEWIQVPFECTCSLS